MLKHIKKFRSVKWFGGSDTLNKRWDFNDCASELAIRTRCGQCGHVKIYKKLLGIPVVYQETGGRDESDKIYCDRNYCYSYDDYRGCPGHADPNGAMNGKHEG